jgi:conjugative relaxase-like TrwC/TraI family protein
VVSCEAAFSQNSAPDLRSRERNFSAPLWQAPNAMLSPKTQTNLANAKSYFQEHLCVGDYYTESERVRGEWLGAGAAMLGLSGTVAQADFLALCENLRPGSRERLTQRQKTTRRAADGEGEVANRRVFFDFTFSPPKSVSVAALVGGDERIATAHTRAVRVAAVELERFAATRVHHGGTISDRPTGNVVAALFQHDTSRALDPHLHTHCILFNATHDPAEKRWKALHNYELLAAQKYVENVYYHELARALRGFGYTVVNSARGDFELAEVSREVRERFSKRHREIDEKTHALLAAEPQKRGANLADIREHIAHKERARKLPPMPPERLRAFWLGQLANTERPVSPAASAGAASPRDWAASEAVTWAENHLFERRSVVHEHELWRHALSAARGGALTLDDIKRETARRDYVRAEGTKLSRRDVLLREWQLVEAARQGEGSRDPLTPPELWQNAELAPDQQLAFTRLASSRDFVTLFRGGAGTGKSYVLRRLQAALSEAKRATVVLAPQRQQVLDLERDDLVNAQTVSECLQRGTLPRGAVIIVDEAGQIGGRQLLEIVQLAERNGGRVVLSGDTRQHGPVEASDALRAIERYSGLHPAELNEIRRQDPKRGATASEQERIRGYRAAVEAAASGDLPGSFEALDALDAIAECGLGEQAARLSDEYLRLALAGESALVVSQTRAEVREVNEAIRARLIAQGILRDTEQTVTALEPVDLTAAQKAETRYYPEDCAVVLNRKTGGCARGSIGKVVAVNAAGVAVKIGSKVRVLGAAELDRISVCRERELALRAGDRLQLKTNGVSADGKKLANGEIVTVAKIERSGVVRLVDGRALPAEFRQFVRGYAVTSYGSQGKTVDHVLFADSAVRAATNAEQWYVTISRGRKSIRIFTADKQQLRDAIRRAGQRELALDLKQAPSRSRRVRELTLRGLKRGREFARRVCMMMSRRAWTPALRERREAGMKI